MLFESNKDNISSDMTSVSKDKIIETNSNIIVNKLILGPQQSNTYTIVYYVKNLKDTDQTSIDAGKQFYAKVRVDSITTGTYAETLMKSRCYEYEQITEGEYTGTYKLTKFNGIDENGIADNTCGVSANGEFYSITVPSKIKDEEGNELEISTLGNKLFAAIIFENKTQTLNSYYFKISEVIIDEGIKEIEDGIYNEGIDMYGIFVTIGFDLETGEISHNFNVKLPNTLNKIGNLAFLNASLEEITIPKNVEIINYMSFASSPLLTKITFEVDKNGSSNLKYIAEGAFSHTKLKEVEIPYSVTYIGERAFDYTETLEKITFLGDLEESSKNQLTIGELAFGYANLTYSTYDNPLILPARVISVGESIFEHSGARYIKFMGTSEALANLGTNWYTHVDYIKSKDEY